MIKKDLIEAEYDRDENRVCIGYPNHSIAPRFMNDSVAVVLEGKDSYEILHAHYNGPLPE